MLIQTFTNNIARRLRDVGKKQWDDEFLISATNAAMAALCRTMPQVYTVNRDLTLADGTEQHIDADLHKIVTILHNVKSDGSAGRAVTQTDMSVLDAAYPQWRQDAPRQYVRHWMVDEFDESTFYVWPPASTKLVEPIDPGELYEGRDTPEHGTLIMGTGNPDDVLGALITTSFDDQQIADAIARGDGTQPSGLPTIDPGSGEVRIFDFDISARDPSVNEAFKQLWMSQLIFPFGTVPTALNGFTSIVTQVRNEFGLIITYGDPAVEAGKKVRIRFDGTGTGHIVSEDEYEVGTTQAQIDQYNAELILYNAAIAAGRTVSPGHIVRGSFSKTPRIDVTPAPVVPDSPVEPVEGEVDDYQTALADYNADLDAYNDALEALAAFNARDVLTADDELPLDDMHVPALEEFALYYCYAVDDDVTANSARANRHWLAFFQMINKAEDTALMINQAREKTE